MAARPAVREVATCRTSPVHTSPHALLDSSLPVLHPALAHCLLNPPCCVQEAALDKQKFSQLEALLNRSQMYTQFLTEQVGTLSWQVLFRRRPPPRPCMPATRPCSSLTNTYAPLPALQITTVEERHQEAAEAAAEQKAAAGAGKKRKGRGAAAAEPAKKGKIDMEALTQVGASVVVC